MALNPIRYRAATSKAGACRRIESAKDVPVCYQRKRLPIPHYKCGRSAKLYVIKKNGHFCGSVTERMAGPKLHSIYTSFDLHDTALRRQSFRPEPQTYIR